MTLSGFFFGMSSSLELQAIIIGTRPSPSFFFFFFFFYSTAAGHILGAGRPGNEAIQADPCFDSRLR